MAVTCHTFTKLNDSLATKLVAFATDSLYVMLLASYTPSQDTHQFLSHVLGAGAEVVGTGYVANGQALTSVTVSEAGHVTKLTCASPSWNPITATPAYAVFYDRTPATDATRPLLAYWDFGGSVPLTAQSFTLAIASGGLLTLTGT